jgi:hypothetical protein
MLARLEVISGRCVMRQEGIAHVSPHFKCGGSNARTQPDEYVSGRHARLRAQLGQRVVHHPMHQAAPTCVGRSDSAPMAVRQQDRQAIRHHDGASLVGLDGHARISDHTIGRVSVQHHHLNAMHLLQKNRPRSAQLRLQKLAIGRHRSRVITDMTAQIETVKRRR